MIALACDRAIFEISVAQNFEWYLKNHQGECSENALVYFHCRAAEFCALRQNHLGSSMLVFGTQSNAAPSIADNGTLKAAYDYHAFGEQLTLVEPTDKVTENFTGKGIRGERCDSRVYSNWHCRAEEHCARRNEKDDEIELNYFGARYLDPMLGLWTSVDPARQFASPYLYAGNGMNPIVGMDEDGNQFNPFGLLVGVGVGVVQSWNAQRTYWENGGTSELEAAGIGLLTYATAVLVGVFSIEGGFGKTVFLSGAIGGTTSALTTAAAQGLAKNSLDGINSDDVEFSFLKGFHTAAIGAFIGYGVSSALGGSVSGSRISLGDAIGGAVGGAITGLLDQCLEPNSESEWSEDK